MTDTTTMHDALPTHRTHLWSRWLCVAALAGLLAGPASGGDFNIATPYTDLGWEEYGQHKANLHTHTTESDGRESPARMIDAYREKGYDILALTDHNRVTWSWMDHDRDPAELEMIAIEGSEPSRHHHIGSYFSDFSSSGDIHDSLKAIGEKDGLAVMFHPGRYNWSLEDYVKVYQRYDHLVGMEVYNQGDRYSGDRALWDQVLTELGHDRPVWGYSNDDAHRLSHVGRNWQTFIMEELNEDAVRNAMVKGHFYFSYTPEQGDPAPVINAIAVDEEAGTISITADGYDEIHWVSEGDTLDVEGNTLDLNHEDAADASGYVRAELQGPKGRTYTQPFFIVDEEDEDEDEEVNGEQTD